MVSEEMADALKEGYPDMPTYTVDGGIKIAAGWLIEKAGWKGRTFENRYGVHKLQALVLVNYKDSRGEEILKLSAEIIDDVKQKFNVSLEREVNIL